MSKNLFRSCKPAFKSQASYAANGCCIEPRPHFLVSPSFRAGYGIFLFNINLIKPRCSQPFRVCDDYLLSPRQTLQDLATNPEILDRGGCVKVLDRRALEPFDRPTLLNLQSDSTHRTIAQIPHLSRDFATLKTCIVPWLSPCADCDHPMIGLSSPGVLQRPLEILVAFMIQNLSFYRRSGRIWSLKSKKNPNPCPYEQGPFLLPLLLFHPTRFSTLNLLYPLGCLETDSHVVCPVRLYADGWSTSYSRRSVCLFRRRFEVQRHQLLGVSGKSLRNSILIHWGVEPPPFGWNESMDGPKTKSLFFKSPLKFSVLISYIPATYE